MKTFLDKYPGPHFEVVVLSDGESWSQCDWQARSLGNFIANAGPLALAEPILLALSDCLQRSHAGFNFYGPTAYHGGNLSALIAALSAWITAATAAADSAEFAGLVGAGFVHEVESHGARWAADWNAVQEEMVTVARKLLDQAHSAQQIGGSLLVLGI